MSPTNGHANAPANGSVTAVQQFAPATSETNIPTALTPNAAEIRELIANLEVPFHPSVIEWRVTNTSKGGSQRGQLMPYADQRAYTDRLNALLTPAGWTRKYTIHTSANFERSADQRLTAKVLVTCELTIFGLGSHSATGEEWADDQNAGTSAEAQAFKRAASCFGLGRYLYYFSRTWVDLDEWKRPKTVPQLTGWATPAGWREGLRPWCVGEPMPNQVPAVNSGAGRHNGNGRPVDGEVLRKIEGMEKTVGKRMYRGILKSVARVWNPKDIQDQAIQEKVLAHMQAAERGLRRAEAAREKAGLATFAAVLGSLRLSSLDQVDNLKTLQEIVGSLEGK
jgi:hypothetical protein